MTAVLTLKGPVLPAPLTKTARSSGPLSVLRATSVRSVMPCCSKPAMSRPICASASVWLAINTCAGQERCTAATPGMH